MNSKERVISAIKHIKPDRVPMNIWMFRKDMSSAVIRRYGSMQAFFKRYHIDVHMAITPPPYLFNPDYLEELMTLKPEDIRPEHWLDPDDPKVYRGVLDLMSEFGKDKSIFAHVWGVVEAIYGFCGIERTLVLMGTEPNFAVDLFAKVEAFSKRVVENLIQLGVDIIHITGDVGSNRTMLFSPDMWREMVRPFDQSIIQPAVDTAIPVSLHSCGYCMPIIPDWINMGIQIIHPIQESAGMDLFEVKEKFGQHITIHGGLDLRALCRLDLGEVEAYIRPRMEKMKIEGGFIFNTAHTVQMDTSLDVLERAYDVALEYSF
jgi:uroporphyrinogen decarboxylase